MRILQFIMSIIAKYLPIWLVVCSIIAYLFPTMFVSVQGTTGFFLGLIFLLMGMSLATEQIVNVVKSPKNALIGFVLKWTVMVGITLIIAFLFFKNNPEIASGIILAGTVPSGTSANLYTFIAGGEVAVSITMATLDTMIAPIVTPSIVQLSIGKVIPINFWALFLNIIWIVFIPLFLGLFLQWKFPRKVDIVRPYTSVISQISLFIIIFSVVSQAQPTLKENFSYLPFIFVAVSLQVIIPMFAGYFLSRLFKVTNEHVIAITFHTGICNTALSATLATEHISALAAVPAVANMIVNLTVGAIVARMFEKKMKENVQF